MRESIEVMFVICTGCDRVWPVVELVEHVHDFETEEGGPLVVHDYHCPECRAKVASYGASGRG